MYSLATGRKEFFQGYWISLALCCNNELSKSLILLYELWGLRDSFAFESESRELIGRTAAKGYWGKSFLEKYTTHMCVSRLLWDGLSYALVRHVQYSVVFTTI